MSRTLNGAPEQSRFPRLRRALWLAGSLLLALPGPASSAGALEPLDLRDEWLLSQTRLTLPAASPDPVPAGRIRLRIEGDWGNDFGFRQQGPGETPIDRSFLVDGEHRVLAVAVQRGLGSRADVGLRLPFHWRGGGILDGLIDGFHSATAAFGIKDNDRPEFPRNRLRVLGRSDDLTPVVWTGTSGSGLGNLEISTRIGLTGPDQRWRSALIGRVLLPTGTGTFRGSGLDLGAQAVAARRLRTAVDLYLGAGGSYYSDRKRHGIAYQAWRLHGFVAAGWQLSERWTLHGQSEASSRLVTNLAEYPGLQWYLRLAVQRAGLGRWRAYAGFTENLAHQQATADFGVFFGMARDF